MLSASLGEDLAGIVLSGPLLVAAVIAAAAGAVSFFSPCCLPLVPGYLSYVSGLAGAERPRGAAAPGAVATASSILPGSGARAGSPGAAASARDRPVLLGAALFVLGFAAVFTGYGAAFGALGSLLLTYQDTLVRVLGALTIILGLAFTGLLWRIPLFSLTIKPRYRPGTGLAAAPLVGVLFGLGWTPCIGPTLAAVLALATSTGDASRGALLAFVYSLGLGVPFLLAAASMQRAMTSFAWARGRTRAIARVGGVMLVLLGLLQVSGAWTALTARLQGVVAGWQVPL